MVDYSKYMNLSLERKKYQKIVAVWKKSIAKTTDLSFTAWITQASEGVILKQVLIEKLYPELKVISATDIFVIEDTKTNQVVKVYVKDGSIQCTSPDNKERYIMFACLHPLFMVG